MDNYCAPQWTDFTCSPQLPSDSYFEIEHETHKPLIHFKSNVKTNLPILWKEESVHEQSISETNFDDSLDTAQNTNDNTAYFIPLGNTKHSVEQLKNDNRLSNAMESLKLDEKSRKIDCAWNVWLTEGTNPFKAPMMPRRLKTALSKKNRQNVRTLETKNTVHSSLQNKQIINNINKNNHEQIASAKIKTEPLIKSDSNYCSASGRVSCTDERASYKIVSARQEHCKTFKGKQSQPKVLTCQYRRGSLVKTRKYSNKFISMAEAVSRFQNKTPQRFRTISNKDLKPGFFVKLKQSPLKLTNPISPALRSKKRARHTTVLSKEEREAMQLEEMKKHQIKAKPVPLNILKAPAALKKVTKKPITVTEEFRLTQPKNMCHKSDSQVNIQNEFNNKEQSHLNTASIIRSVSASNVATKKEPNTRKELSMSNNAKPATSVLSSNFAARNKEFQMRKEEKLKSLQIQETNKMKVEFHARPVPKFLKQPLSIKDQNLKRRTVASCPFSFAERDKNLAKKKEEHVKQIHENNKITRAFHANPIPRYKPRGLSKENVRGKEKDANSC